MADYDRARLNQLRAKFRGPAIVTAGLRELIHAGRHSAQSRRRTAGLDREQLAKLDPRQGAHPHRKREG